MVLTPNGLSLGKVDAPVRPPQTCTVDVLWRTLRLLDRTHQQLRDDGDPTLESRIAVLIDQAKKCLQALTVLPQGQTPPPAVVEAARFIIAASGWGDQALLKMAQGVVQPSPTSADDILNWLKKNWWIVALAAVGLVVFGRRR